MSRFKRLWVLLVPTAMMLVLGTLSPVQAAPPSQPPPPVADDACGVSKDRFFAVAGQPLEDINWRDSLGNSYAPGAWNSTRDGAASVTLIATVSTIDGTAEYTYAPMIFSAESDASCVDAPDTVTTKVLECNRATSGTKVSFTYTNVAENGRSRTDPTLLVDRWDSGQSAAFTFRFGEVIDGESVTVVGGDTLTEGFFLSPGTYNMRLITKETGTRRLPNRLFVPGPCGKYSVPPGDPIGGSNPPVKSKPRAFIGKCFGGHKVRITFDSRKATKLTRYQPLVDPRKGKQRKLKPRRVAAGDKKVVVLRHQKRGNLIKVRYDGKISKRVIRC